MTSIINRVKEIVSECVYGCPIAPEEMRDETSLVDDLGADSLEILEIAFAIEDEIGFSFGDDVIEGWVTVGDVVKSVRRAEERGA